MRGQTIDPAMFQSLSSEQQKQAMVNQALYLLNLSDTQNEPLTPDEAVFVQNTINTIPANVMPIDSTGGGIGYPASIAPRGADESNYLQRLLEAFVATLKAIIGDLSLKIFLPLIVVGVLAIIFLHLLKKEV